MIITLGNKGLDKSWQAPFKEEVECSHCPAIARIAFTAYENGYGQGQERGTFICDLHKNEPEKDGAWLHDVAAYAIYHCKSCYDVTTKWNQG